jgi:hypothetical protein
MERSDPINYKSMSISSREIEYVTKTKKYTIPYETIVTVEFIREEALFPCLDGPYLETKWMLNTISGKVIEIMDEAPHRKKILEAFSRFLPGFNFGHATVGLKSESEGRWLCFQRAQS